VHHRGVKRKRIFAAWAATFLTLTVGPAINMASAAATQKLPDLAVVAPFEFRIIVRDDGHKRLRFTTIIANIGQGPFRIYGYDEDGTAKIGDDLLVRQRILQSDGAWVERDTTATMFWGGDGHNHFHVEGLTLAKIQTPDGKTTLKTIHKIGFCFLDSYNYGSSAGTTFDADHHVCQPAPNGRVPMGVSVRWADIYRSTIAHQWIDITGLPNGEYKIKVIADPPWETGGRFRESNEDNNRGWTNIRITGSSVTVISKSARP
jgi:Lysyl oxidase